MTTVALRKRLAAFGRTFWTTTTGWLRDEYTETKFSCTKTSPDKAMLISSLREDGSHAPVLDIDFSAQLIPSTTEGHFHLYLDKKMSWKEYKDLLRALLTAGIIQQGFYDMSIKRGQSMVLLPGVNRNKVTTGPRLIT